jgi:hypothetical protein
MLTVVIWVLVATVFLLLLALAMPLRLELQVTREEAVQFTAALRPFGRFGPRIAFSDRSKTPKQHKTSKKPAERSRWKLNPKRMARAAIHLAGDLIGCVRFEAATVDVRFGLGDPAETGQVYGQMTPLIYGTSGLPRVHVNVRPEFGDAVLKGRAALDVSLIPLYIFPPFVRFAWTAFGPSR